MVKARIYKLVEKGAHGHRFNKLFDYFIMALILLSVIVIILETIPEIHLKYVIELHTLDFIIVSIFTVEYFLRIYVSDLTHPASSRVGSALNFILSPYGLIDLLAIMPFFLPDLEVVDLRFIRLLRILKFHRYSDSLGMIWAVFKEKRSELGMTGFLSLLILVLSSFLLFYAEHNHQPEVFPNVLEAFWWAAETLTTVGYGDIYPVTGIGKFISGIIAFLGIALVALPTGIISAGFMEKLQERKGHHKKEKTCPHCGEKL